MAEYVGVSYLEVIRHAFLPAVISYLALVYIVHLEAVKAGMAGLQSAPGSVARSAGALALRGGLIISFLLAVIGAAYFALSALKRIIENETALVIAVVVLAAAAYLLLLRVAAKKPDLPPDNPSRPLINAPSFAEVWPTGAYFSIPVFALVWFLMVERKSPGLSVFWAVVFLAAVAITHKMIKEFFRGGAVMIKLREGWRDFCRGLASGARQMIAIAIATAAAGIIVGAVTLTGMQQFVAELIETLSGGNLIVILLLAAAFSLVLGMGLPTTANYIVVSSLMAGVIVELGAQNGLIVPSPKKTDKPGDLRSTIKNQTSAKTGMEKYAPVGHTSANDGALISGRDGLSGGKSGFLAATRNNNKYAAAAKTTTAITSAVSFSIMRFNADKAKYAAPIIHQQKRQTAALSMRTALCRPYGPRARILQTRHYRFCAVCTI